MSATAPIKLVAIGGGTGLATLLGGLRPYLNTAQPRLELTAIVTVTDDGKSSGRLRDEFAVLPPGDIRHCLAALAPDDDLLAQLFRHRFPGNGALGGHSLGNLLILALNQMSGNFLTAVEQARTLLGVVARVLPATLDRVDLVASCGGRTVRGQVAIKAQNLPIKELMLTPPGARALPAAVEAIMSADLITLGPGSLFTSVIANLLVPGIREALEQTGARKIYICNVMTEFDETDGFAALDHVKSLLSYAPELRLDYALFNSAPISPLMRQRYAAERAIPLDPPASTPDELSSIRFIALPLASEARAVRHDSDKLSRALLKFTERETRV
jgi:uncharacterized cofD-like protein